MTATSPIEQFTKALLFGTGPLMEWKGAAGTVRSFVYAACSGSQEFGLTLDDLVLLLRRRLDELADAVSCARHAIDQLAAEVAETP